MEYEIGASMDHVQDNVSDPIASLDYSYHL